MDRDLNHDEHQFLAPAALLSREGLQPWRDYALFHLPNLVFVYAAAGTLTGNIILGAKLVSFSASALLVLGLVVAAMRVRRVYIALILGLTAILLLLTDPLFRYTAGKTWNHEVPSALLIGAIASLAAAARRDNLWLTAAAGVFVGLATGCRLTFAPTFVGLLIFVWLMPLVAPTALLPRLRTYCGSHTRADSVSILSGDTTRRLPFRKLPVSPPTPARRERCSSPGDGSLVAKTAIPFQRNHPGELVRFSGGQYCDDSTWLALA
jgi:hypothetical protein